MGLTFRVNRHVLIPRQDTETLVEQVLAEQTDRSRKVLDLCTGSGCIAISLSAKGGYEDVTAADLSGEALAVAEENARRLLGDTEIFMAASETEAITQTALEAIAPTTQENVAQTAQEAVEPTELETHEVTVPEATVPVPAPETTVFRKRFTLCRGDLFQALRKGERFDILVSNPPYIPTQIIKGLQPEVKDHEPMMALDGDADGLTFYRRIAGEAKEWLNPGASVYLEIGHDQGEAVSRLMEEADFQNIKVIKDLPGMDRVVRADY
jgi:release factor glutamine methyltransferase